MIEVVPYTANQRDAWNHFIGESANGTFLFNRGFMDYHADRFTDQSLMAYEDGKLVAVLPASLGAERRIVSHGGLTYGGMVTGQRMNAALAMSLFEALLHHYRQAGFLSLLYKPVPHIYHRRPAETDLHALFVNGARLCRSDLSATIPLQSTAGFAKSKRAGIKAAEKAGVSVAESRNFAGFWALLADTLDKRHGTAPTHSQSELELLGSRFPREIRLFEASLQHRIGAGLLVFDCGPVIHVQYIASSEEGRAVGAVDAVVAHLVTEVFRDRMWFDFGISTENQGRDLNVGLSRQKEMFGASSTVYQQYLVDL